MKYKIKKIINGARKINKLSINSLETNLIIPSEKIIIITPLIKVIIFNLE